LPNEENYLRLPMIWEFQFQNKVAGRINGLVNFDLLVKIYFQSFKKNLDTEELQRTKCKLFWRQSILIPSDYYSPDKILYEIILTKGELCTKKINLQKFQPKFEISQVVWIIFSIYGLSGITFYFMTCSATGFIIS
jgi:hypothetical protein